MPRDYTTTNVGGSENIRTGGHKCAIKEVKEVVSKNGNNMLLIRFDTDNADAQPMFFTKLYNAERNSRGTEAKWKGNYYIVTSGQYGTANLKRFVTSVEHSNPGFRVQWDTQPGDGRFVNCFTGRKIGVIFGQEEYEKQDGNIGKSTKPVRVCDYAKAAEAEIPPLKTMSAKNKKKAETGGFSGYTDQPMPTEEFMQMDAMTDPGLPFM